MPNVMTILVLFSINFHKKDVLLRYIMQTLFISSFHINHVHINKLTPVFHTSALLLIKVAVDPQDDSLGDPQTALMML